MYRMLKRIVCSLVAFAFTLNLNSFEVCANNNNIDLDQKKEYPYSAECLIEVMFRTPEGRLYSYLCTGQLVNKNKILTCGHEFKYNEQLLYNALDNTDKLKSFDIIRRPRDELYELEVKRHKDIIKQKESERQEKIISYSNTQDKNRDSDTNSNTQDKPKDSGIIRRPRDELYELEVKRHKDIIKQQELDKQIEAELANELQYKLAWEFPEFVGITVDFRYDTKTQCNSTDNLYTIPKENIFMHQEYDFINPENDLALIKTDKNIGYTYGWFGLISKLEDSKQYRLTGYPTENNSTVFKNLSLTSRTGNFDTNIGIKSDLLYWYQLNTSHGFSGAGLRVKSKYGNDYRIISIHHGKDENGRAIGVRMTKDKIDWIINN